MQLSKHTSLLNRLLHFFNNAVSRSVKIPSRVFFNLKTQDNIYGEIFKITVFFP